MRKILFLMLVAACAISLSACKTMCPMAKAKEEAKAADAKTCAAKKDAEKKAECAKADVKKDEAKQPAVKPLFEKMDGADNDKVITPAEFQARRKAWLKEEDANKDGKISMDEFAEAKFVEMDGPDQDGIITVDEYIVVMVGADQADAWKKADAGKSKGACFMAMDKNGDDKLTMEEFIIHRKGWFKVMDANDDGKVDKAEFQKLRKAEHDARDADNNAVLAEEEFIAITPMAPAEAKKDADKPKKETKKSKKEKKAEKDK